MCIRDRDVVGGRVAVGHGGGQRYGRGRLVDEAGAGGVYQQLVGRVAAFEGLAPNGRVADERELLVDRGKRARRDDDVRDDPAVVVQRRAHGLCHEMCIRDRIDEIQVENLALIRKATLEPARGLTCLLYTSRCV